MASRALAAAAQGPGDYVRVYDRILGQVKEPVILHWLGEMFDPALEGYWGSGDHWEAMETCLDVIAAHADKVDGIKISLLVEGEGDRHAPAAAGRRRDVHRRRLQLRRADRRGRGGAFGRAARHLRRDRAGGVGGARRRWRGAATTSSSTSSSRRCRCRGTSSRRRPGSTRPGVVFLAYLNGLQDHFVMVGGQESARSLVHLAELFRLADRARVLQRSGAGGGADARRARGAGRRLMTPVEGLSINLATVRAQWDMRQAVEACLRHGITAIAPWRDQVAAIGLERGGAARARQRAAGDRALPRRVLSGARRPRSGRGRSTTTGARSTRRPRSAPTAW